jgi:hypothetical protein
VMERERERERARERKRERERERERGDRKQELNSSETSCDNMVRSE